MQEPASLFEMRCVSFARWCWERAWRGSRSSIIRPPSIDIASSPLGGQVERWMDGALEFSRTFQLTSHFGTRLETSFKFLTERRSGRRTGGDDGYATADDG